MNLKLRLCLILLSIILVAKTTSSAQELHNFLKVKEYNIDVSFKPEKAFMKGKAIITFYPDANLDLPIVFYLHGELSVDSVVYKGKKVKFKQKSLYYYSDYSLIAKQCTLYIDKLDDNQEITIEYSGFFNPSKARSPSDYMRISKNEVLLRSYGYSLWYPVFLDANQNSYKTDFKKVTLRTPQNLKSVFVGRKLNEYVEGNIRVTQWEALNNDIQSTQCTARQYDVIGNGENYIYYMKDEASTKAAKEISVLFEKLLILFKSRYKEIKKQTPFYLLEMPEYGDISNDNVSGLSTEIWGNFSKHTWTKRFLAHELVHPFVQIKINRKNPLYALVIEGHPCYFYLPVLETILGKDWYLEYMRSIEKNYLIKKKTKKHPRGWKLPKEKAILDISADEIREYKDVFVLSDRVLLFFDYLKRKMGDEKFQTFSKKLVNLESIDYNQLKNLIQKYLPESEEDIRVWLKESSYPPKFHLDDH